MKKGLMLVLSFVFVVSMVLVMVEFQVSALWIMPPSEQPAEGDWQYASDVPGEKVHMSELTVPAPQDWMLLMANGVRLETQGATELCHPFGGAQYGWVGGIYLLNGKSWMAMPTTTEWVPDEEGQMMTCTQAPMSGVYALFAYCGEDCKITGPVWAVAVNLPDVVMDLPEVQFSVE